MPETVRNPLGSRFERFAHECATLGSPFYEELSRFVAQNDELLDIASHAHREPVPNVYFAAVHYLLLGGRPHELRNYYASITDPPRDSEHLHSIFASFCAEARDELIALVASRLVQTNEINRSAVLAPAISLVFELANRCPLALVEVGASAGLNLNWDRYRIEYSDGVVLGDPESLVTLTCELRGDRIPAAATAPPQIVHRIGIDLNPIDLNDEDQRLWLRALVWPDQRHRAHRLDAAIDLALEYPPNLFRGNALRLLPDTIAHTAHDLTICIYHSAVLYQFSRDEQDRFSSILAEASHGRPIWHVSAENEDGLRLLQYRDGKLVSDEILAAIDAHGRWLSWNSSR